MSSLLAVITVLLLVFLVGVMTPALLRLCRPCRAQELTDEWFTRLGTTSYEPMDTLLSEEDFRFLSRQPGYDWRLYRKLRQDRLRIFRQYLHRMIIDFNRLHLAARLSLSQSGSDESERFDQLIRLKLRFSVSVLRVEVRWVLCQAGVGALCAGELISSFNELHQIFSSTSLQAPA